MVSQWALFSSTVWKKDWRRERYVYQSSSFGCFMHLMQKKTKISFCFLTYQIYKKIVMIKRLM